MKQRAQFVRQSELNNVKLQERSVRFNDHHETFSKPLANKKKA